MYKLFGISLGWDKFLTLKKYIFIFRSTEILHYFCIKFTNWKIMKKFFVSVLILALFATGAWAKPVSKKDAIKCA